VMHDSPFDAMLTRRLKQAGADIAQAIPGGVGFVPHIVSRRRETANRWTTRRLIRARAGIAAALVIGVAIASGTAYAGITLLQTVIQTDPGAAAAYRQNLGEALNLSQTRDGVTLTLVRAYADINRAMITYQVKASGGASTFAGFASSNGQPVVTDTSGQALVGYDAYFETDPQTNVSVGTVVYDAETAAQNVRELSLRVAVPGVRMTRNGDPMIVGPYAFGLTVPVVSGETMATDETVTVHGITVTLDRVVVSPSETRIYLESSDRSLLKGPYLTARITGIASDTSNAVTTSVSELIDMGSTFQAPDGQQVVTFTNTLFGKRGSFRLSIDSLGASERIAGPWVFHFQIP
jgi:hypothetical protein